MGTENKFGIGGFYGLNAKLLATIDNVEISFTTRTTPLKLIDKDLKRTYIFNAVGFTKENLVVEQEFINRTKELNLTIKGEYKDEYLGIENNLDICIAIDYNIYDSYEISVHNGILYVEVFEIINDKPYFQRLGSKNISF